MNDTRPGKAPRGWGALDVCPACRATHLVSVSDGENTNFFCAGCDRCWRVELGWVSRIEPRTCPGCHLRGNCAARSVETAAG